MFSIGSAYLRIARAFFTGSPAVKRASASGASCTQIRIHGVQGDMPICRRTIQANAQLFLQHDLQLPLTSMTAACVYRGTQDCLASEDAMPTSGGASAEGATTHAAATRLIANFRSVSPKVLACGGQALVSIIRPSASQDVKGQHITPLKALRHERPSFHLPFLIECMLRIARIYSRGPASRKHIHRVSHSR